MCAVVLPVRRMRHLRHVPAMSGIFITLLVVIGTEVAARCLLDWPGDNRGELGPGKGVWVENLRSARVSSLIVIGLKTGRGCAGHSGRQ